MDNLLMIMGETASIIGVFLLSLIIIIIFKITERKTSGHMRSRNLIEFIKAKGGTLNIFENAKLRLGEIDDLYILEFIHRDKTLEKIILNPKDLEDNEIVEFTGAWNTYIKKQVKKLIVQDQNRETTYVIDLEKERKMAYDEHIFKYEYHRRRNY